MMTAAVSLMMAVLSPLQPLYLIALLQLPPPFQPLIALEREQPLLVGIDLCVAVVISWLALV